MDKLYKRLSFTQIDLITSKLQSFIKDVTEINTCVYQININDVLVNIPELATQLDEYQFSNLAVMAILVTAPNSDLRIHNDGIGHSIALNWPLLNFDDTTMRWFAADVLLKDHYEEQYGIFDVFNRDTAILIEEIPLDQPTLVHISGPHDVSNPKPTARFMLSMRFEQDPILLFNS